MANKSNNFPLTIRLPHELNVQLQEAAKKLGMTRTDLLRIAIHFILPNNTELLDFSVWNGKKDRLVLNVNQLTLNILQDICDKYSQSMNSVVTAVAILALEHSKGLLQ